MKTVKVQGGLGNQLFCFAFAHSIAVLTGESVALDLAGYRRDRYGHRFLLADLAARMGGLALSSRPVLADRRVGAVLRRLPLNAYVGEGAPPGGLAALKRIAERGAYFDGYWQNEAYMAEPEILRAQVRAFLDGQAPPAPSHDLLIHYRTYKDEVRPVRRGTPSGDFFQQALATVEAKIGRVGEIALISDDPALAVERLGDLGRRVIPVVGGSAQADMALMLAARSLIATNSSFSWWGGFCGDAGMVIYPRREGLYHYPIPARRFIVV